MATVKRYFEEGAKVPVQIERYDPDATPTS
jgi:hypothetical protein